MSQRIIKIKKNALVGEYVDLFLLWTAHADLYNCLNAFVMWMYFATIKEEEEIPMRQQYICSLTSMSVSSYKRAFKKLKDLFLTPLVLQRYVAEKQKYRNIR